MVKRGDENAYILFAILIFRKRNSKMLLYMEICNETALKYLLKMRYIQTRELLEISKSILNCLFSKQTIISA